MSFPNAGEKTIDSPVAVVEDAFVAKEVFPQNIFIARHGDEVGVGKIFAAGVEAEPDVIFVVDVFLFFVDIEQEGLKGVGGFGRFVFVPGIEIRMFVSGWARYLVTRARVSLSSDRVPICRQHVGGGVLREDFGQFVGLASDEIFDLGFLCVEAFLLGFVAFNFFFRSERGFVQFGVIEDAEQGVEVLRGDGIVFVVVAGGAGHGEGHEAAGGGVNAIILKLGAEGVEAKPASIVFVRWAADRRRFAL